MDLEAARLADELGGTVEYTGLFGLGLTCLALFIIGAIFAIIGGIAALKRKSWGLALAGSIIGLIFGTLVLVEVSQESGVFHFISVKILKMTNGDPKKLLRYFQTCIWWFW